MSFQIHCPNCKHVIGSGHTYRKPDGAVHIQVGIYSGEVPAEQADYVGTGPAPEKVEEKP